MSNRFKKDEWEMWGRWIQHTLFTSPWAMTSKTDVYTSLGFTTLTDIVSLDGYYFYGKKDKGIETFSDFVAQQLQKKTDWFVRVFSIADQKATDVEATFGKHDVVAFLHAMTECLTSSMVMHFIDIVLEKQLTEQLTHSAYSFSDLLPYMVSDRKTYLMEYAEERKNLKEEDIEAFVKKYEWVGTHGFRGDKLTAEQVRESLKTEENQVQPRVLPNELSAYKPMIDIGKQISFYRSFLVEVVDRVGYYYWNDLKQVGKNHDLSWDELRYCSHLEIIDMVHGKPAPTKEQLALRKKSLGVTHVNGKIEIFGGDRVREELAQIKQETAHGVTELKGIVACKGKARGVAKVIKTINEMSKLQKGEILVAYETTPDFIVAMKKAAAIVTNQGGITSHAAIVSRELNIPCVIGTQYATEMIKDGDRVEVDAEKGFITISKN